MQGGMFSISGINLVGKYGDSAHAIIEGIQGPLPWYQDPRTLADTMTGPTIHPGDWNNVQVQHVLPVSVAQSYEGLFEDILAASGQQFR